MRILTPLLAIGIGVVAAVLVYWLVTGRQPTPVEAPTSVSTPAAPAAPSVSGNYADDWQTRCAPLTQAAAQANCTQQLDTAYGRKAGAPVPSNR